MFWLRFCAFWDFLDCVRLSFFAIFLSGIIAYKEDKIYVDFISVPKHNMYA